MRFDCNYRHHRRRVRYHHRRGENAGDHHHYHSNSLDIRIHQRCECGTQNKGDCGYGSATAHCHGFVHCHEHDSLNECAYCCSFLCLLVWIHHRIQGLREVFFSLKTFYLSLTSFV